MISQTPNFTNSLGLVDQSSLHRFCNGVFGQANNGLKEWQVGSDYWRFLSSVGIHVSVPTCWLKRNLVSSWCF
ncbi:MAG: hypothetical protein CMJ80_01570 [Planctomycetaceae bacterium]|nr:hypothetical protein [Planctomycetaceae bacterium]